MTSPSANGFKVLVLTDHRIHSPVESTYALGRAISANPNCAGVWAASRGVAANQDFFAEPGESIPVVQKVDETFLQSPDGAFFQQPGEAKSLSDFDFIWLRLSRSNSIPFFKALEKVFPPQRIVNRPSGIVLTGDKSYLLNFPHLCAPMALCQTMEEVDAFRSRFPIVLKPLNNSGGKGLMRIDGDQVYMEGQQWDWATFRPQLEASIGQGYLGMKYLKNVSQGDKRVIVANGHVVAAALRIPAPGNWLANVSQGASSHMSEPDADELVMATELSRDLLKQGIALFGFDTLVDDNGKRVLSEINSSCVNGIYPAEIHSGKPVVRQTADHLCNYITQHI